MFQFFSKKAFTPLENHSSIKGNSLTGFTLLELIIVLAILAIIASAAVARFVDMAKKATDVQEHVTIQSLKTAVLLFKAVNGYWPAELGKDGSAPYDRDIIALLENPPPYLFLQPFPWDGKTWGVLPGAASGSQGYWISCPHPIPEGGDTVKKWFYSREDGIIYKAGEIIIFNDNPH